MTDRTGMNLDELITPLAQALHKIRTGLAAWSDSEIWSAQAAMNKCSPLDPDDEDLCEAERILGDALARANAERIAKNAPWLGIDVEQQNGRWVVSAWHDQGQVMKQECVSHEAAMAAGEALREFCALQGRNPEFTWRAPAPDRKPANGPPADDTEMPF